MATIEKSIEVDVPVRTAYNQWTQFEEFPRFMEGVTEVKQLDDARLHWVAAVAGQTKEWDARITEQLPDKIVAWRSESGDLNAGTVRFDSSEPDKTCITLVMEYEPEGVVESAGDLLGFVSRRVDADLSRFKEFIEDRGVETGAWRGTIRPGASATDGVALGNTRT